MKELSKTSQLQVCGGSALGYFISILAVMTGLRAYGIIKRRFCVARIPHH